MTDETGKPNNTEPEIIPDTQGTTPEIHFTPVPEATFLGDRLIPPQLPKRFQREINGIQSPRLSDVLPILDRIAQEETTQDIGAIGNVLRHEYLVAKEHRVLIQLQGHLEEGYSIEDLQKKIPEIAKQTIVSETTVREALKIMETRVQIERLRKQLQEQIQKQGEEAIESLIEEDLKTGWMHGGSDILKVARAITRQINGYNVYSVLRFFTQEESPKFLYELDLPKALRKAITLTHMPEGGIMTVKQLIDTSLRELQKIRGVGIIGIITLAMELRRNGYIGNKEQK